METIFRNTENSKTNESHKFVLNLSQKLDLSSSNKRVAFQNLFSYYIWENIRLQHKNNKFKIKTPTWNDKFEVLDGSYSVPDIQNCIKYIIKSMKHFPLTLLFMFISK